MKDLKSLAKKYWYSAAILLLFLIAVFLRVYRLESLPDVLHIDEAGLGYNAWCLVHYGTDRYLNVRPFYPQNFYGGQSPLYTYLLALLIRTVGQGNLSLTLLKIPAVLASLLLFFVGTKSIRLVFDDQKWSIAAAFLLAVCPYYIMSARFALDCNLMLCCSAVALLFLIRFTQTKTLRNLILSGVFFGITMYSYALSYFLIPVSAIHERNILPPGSALGCMCMYYSSARNIICMLPVIPLGNHSFSGAYHISHRLRAHVRCGSHFFLGKYKRYHKDYLDMWFLPFRCRT